jgi:hypothetical protein
MPRRDTTRSGFPGWTRKLPLMLICVAIDTTGKLDFESGRLACRCVARCALDDRMRKGQWEAGLRMIGNRERGRAPALNSVAAFASAFIRTRKELAAVWIGLVAVCAGSVGNWCFEIASCVAGQAGYVSMFAEQRKACLRMVESC